MKTICIIILFSISISCQTNNKQQTTKRMTANRMSNEIAGKNFLPKINGSIGVVTANDKYEYGDTIWVYNVQKKPLTSIVLTDEYQVLALKCLSQQDNYFKVLLDEIAPGYNHKTGLIEKNNPFIKFESWEEHIIKEVFSVDFDSKINPIRKQPNKKAFKLFYERDQFYHPVKILGNWLQIKWEIEGKWQYGWIRWKEKGTLLIELYYFA